MICQHLNGMVENDPKSIAEERKIRMRIHFKAAMAYAVKHDVYNAQ